MLCVFQKCCTFLRKFCTVVFADLDRVRAICATTCNNCAKTCTICANTCNACATTKSAQSLRRIREAPRRSRFFGKFSEGTRPIISKPVISNMETRSARPAKAMRKRTPKPTGRPSGAPRRPSGAPGAVGFAALSPRLVRPRASSFH